MKKLLAVLLTLVMVGALALSAFAANETYSITIEQERAGHVYEAYQIFVGDVSTQDDGKLVLTDIEWGNGVTTAGKEALGDAQAKADSLKTTADAEAFAKEVAAYLTNTSTASTYSAADKNYVIENLPAGYYLLKDRDGSLDETNQGYTSYILKVVGDTTATPKDGTTTSEKKVDDKNDSTGAEDAIEWHDSADHDIGDKIDFKLEATIAEDYAEYKTYYLAFHDVEEKGLTFDPSSVNVYVDGTIITTGYEVITDTDDGCTFEVVFEDLKTLTEATVKAGSKVTVRYQSELNSDAILGSQGNVNKMYAEFSNNPNDEQGGRGTTEWDTVIVFTYKVVVNKVDENLEPLAGATFTLEKFIADANGSAEYNGVMGKWVAISTVETEPETVFTFKGLDDGIYRLTETEAPELYNTIDPVYFTVTANHDIEWTTQDRTDVLTSLTGNVATGELEFTEVEEEGKLSTDVVNERGLVLPETGGIGTTIFYIIGAILVIGAAVILITKRRMSVQK